LKNDPRPEAVQTRPPSVDATLDDLGRAPFGLMDILRRAQGDAFGAFGLDPSECPYRVVASGSYWRLRDYGSDESSASLLIVAAPIKRPYIWDLSPSASAIRYCLGQGLHVFLLEWLPASHGIANNGLDEYSNALDECMANISDAGRGGKPFLIGHSLGGTLAAIYAAVRSERLKGLVLLGAPLCFEPQTNGFRDALVSLVPPNLSQAEPFPGSLLSHMSALASPATFIWSRLIDAALSATDQQALDIHARVERWALDEVPLPGKLVHQIIEWLYRENRFFSGELKIGKTQVGPSTVSVPTLAAVNMSDDVAPLTSVKPFLDAMPKANGRIIDYPGEVGVCLQHLSMLVGRQARAQVWPQIISWLRSQS
jgi:polyhydroxyalkanoate synthase subunit PhaC